VLNGKSSDDKKAKKKQQDQAKAAKSRQDAIFKLPAAMGKQK